MTTTRVRTTTVLPALAAVLALGLSACSGDGTGGDNGDDAASADSPSAPGSQDLVAKMQAIAPWLSDEDALEGAEDTCEDIAEGQDDQQVVAEAVDRFSEDDLEDEVDAGQAQQLIQLAEQYYCSQ